MADAVATNLTFVTCEFKRTQTGKDRWTARTADGREIGIWDKNLAEAVGAHLHEDLVAEVTTKESNGNWYTNLQALPALGIQQAPRQANGSGGGQQVNTPVADLGPLTAAVERIALALDNLLAFATDAYLSQGQVKQSPAYNDPPEPDGP